MRRFPPWVITLSLLPLSLWAQSAPPPHYRAAVDLTIGGADDNRDASLFEDVRGLTLDKAGRILVAEYEANEVRVFSPNGKLLYKFGRAGAGPGDLKGPCCISLAPNGALWVKEFTNHRYSVFALDADRGTYRWGITLPRAVSWGGDDPIRWDARGNLVDLNGRPFVGGKPTGLFRSLIDSSGNVLRQDAFDEPSSDSVPMAVHITHGPNGSSGSSGAPQPYGPDKLRAFGPNGEAAEAVSSRYAVSWDDGANKRVALLKREVAGPPLSGKERQRAGQMIASTEKSWGERFPFGVPDRKPPLSELGFDLDGRLWVELSVPQGQPHQADVYDRAHHWIATMEWPANVDLEGWAIRGNTGVGIARDADGVKSVVRLRFSK